MNYLRCITDDLPQQFDSYKKGDIVKVNQSDSDEFIYYIPCNPRLGYKLGSWGFDDITEIDNYFEVVELNDNKHDEHYKSCGIEPWDIMQANFTKEEFKGFLKGNILKYLMRIGRKGQDLDDCDKIANYANKLKEVLQKDIRQD